MPILCLILLAADATAGLATARGSFALNGWKVWNNATVFAKSRIQTRTVPVKISLNSGQTLWVGDGSAVRFTERTISLEKGCARLEGSGVYALAVASPIASRSCDIPRQYMTLRELRPMSQRP